MAPTSWAPSAAASTPPTTESAPTPAPSKPGGWPSKPTWGAVAHDLRTPLASLQLHLERAAARPAEAGEAVEVALGETTYLAGLVEDLWVETLLRLDESQGRHRADLRQVVRQLLARYRPLAQRRGVELEAAWPDVAAEVVARPLMVARALGNLVHNAIAHNRPGGHVAVLLELTEAGFAVQVLDDGPGLPPGGPPQGAARSRDPDGGGLGLGVTRGVCARYGWTFELGPGPEGAGCRAALTGPLAG